jgi:hypothetical protein
MKNYYARVKIWCEHEQIRLVILTSWEMCSSLNCTVHQSGSRVELWFASKIGARFNPISTGTGLNQPLYSYHVTQAGRNRVKVSSLSCRSGNAI